MLCESQSKNIIFCVTKSKTKCPKYDKYSTKPIKYSHGEPTLKSIMEKTFAIKQELYQVTTIKLSSSAPDLRDKDAASKTSRNRGSLSDWLEPQQL